MSGQWGWPLLHAAVTEPIALTVAVLVFGAVARLMRPTFDRGVERLIGVISARWIYFVLIVSLGLLSSVITAVIAALILVEAIALLEWTARAKSPRWSSPASRSGWARRLRRWASRSERSRSPRFMPDFWYLVRLLGPLVVAGILIVGAGEPLFPVQHGDRSRPHAISESWADVAIRAGKVYMFVAGLVGLSWGLRPLVDEYISRMPQALLFWLNSISAVVDNATLTAAEIGPAVDAAQQRGVLMGLLISGGMLIPGNIPNIVAAGRLGICSREWARVGLITGVPLMALCFAVLLWMG